MRRKIKRFLASRNQNILFDGDDRLFKQKVLDANVVGEYGCGKSTNWILKNTNAQLLSVDTSSQWVKRTCEINSPFLDRLSIEHVDVGPLGNWGRPVGYSHAENFSTYTDSIWSHVLKPDLIIVDGRFRVACFLTSLKNADEGALIFFDDYTNRPHYHYVENYVSRVEVCGRQSMFIVPPKNTLDMQSLDRDIERFRYVLD